MAKIIRIAATVFSCCTCAAMIYFSSTGNADAIYTCLIACIISFFVNMAVTAHINAKKLEAMQKAQEEKAAEAE